MKDLIKELSNGEYEQSTAGAATWVKTSTKKQKDCVIVLREMEKAERVRRVCRTLKYHLKLIGPNSTVLSVKNVSNEESDEKQVCKIRGAEHKNKQTNNRAKLKLHVEEHQLRRQGSRFTSGLSENLKNQGGERIVQTFSHQIDLNAQLAKCKKNVCSLCGTEQSNLKRHMRIHTRERPYNCSICAKAFSRSDWLAKHMSTHKEKTQACEERRKKRYTCDHCGNKYKRKEYLQNHLRSHTGERPFPCAVCEKRFYNKSDLMQHLMCHSDDRPFTCSDCGHGFKRIGTLNKHKRIHTGEKPYSCRNCRKRFRYRYCLTMHSKICSL